MNGYTTGMSAPAPPPDPRLVQDSGQLQFERAEFTEGSSGPVCCTCKQPATPEYHQCNGRIFCVNCRHQIEASIQQMRDQGNLPGAFLFGLGAAALGAAIFYAVSAITGYEFGLIAVVVGWLVGKAVRKGSRTAGGLQFQILAMLLTYISIVSTYVPGIARALAHGAPLTAGDFVAAMPLAFASPVLAGFQNIFGLIIIAIGLWEAWKFNRRVEVTFTGPFAAAQ